MKSCCIIGHREIEITARLQNELKNKLIYLIKNEDVKVFYFGSRSEFCKLCYNVITNLKNEYARIKRVYVRAEYANVGESYENYLNEFYEDSFYYDENLKAGRFSYIKRNEFMINVSDFCLFYYNKSYTPSSKTKSGTAIAYNYAVKNSKTIINLYKN